MKPLKLKPLKMQSLGLRLLGLSLLDLSLLVRRLSGAGVLSLGPLGAILWDLKPPNVKLLQLGSLSWRLLGVGVAGSSCSHRHVGASRARCVVCGVLGGVPHIYTTVALGRLVGCRGHSTLHLQAHGEG